MSELEAYAGCDGLMCLNPLRWSFHRLRLDEKSKWGKWEDVFARLHKAIR